MSYLKYAGALLGAVAASCLLVLLLTLDAAATSSHAGVKAAIRQAFGGYGEQAVRVARCETGGTFSVYARNGQYLGLFQMGAWERARYGHSWTATGQSRAAHRYFVASGRDWSPWSCKP